MQPSSSLVVWSREVWGSLSSTSEELVELSPARRAELGMGRVADPVALILPSVRSFNGHVPPV